MANTSDDLEVSFYCQSWHLLTTYSLNICAALPPKALLHYLIKLCVTVTQGAQVADSESERSPSHEDNDEDGANDTVSENASETSSTSGLKASTTTLCQEFSTPAAPKKARIGKRKASDETSAVDSSLAAMAQFFKAKTSAVSQPPPTDEDILFGTMIATEIKKIQQPAIKRQLKKAIYDAVYEAQTADLEPQRQPASAQYFIVQADGSLTEVCPQ